MTTAILIPESTADGEKLDNILRRENRWKSALQIKKFSMPAKLRGISFTTFHTGVREKEISLTGRHYVIEETFHCVTRMRLQTTKRR